MKLTTEIVRELLDYDPETGVLTWRTRSREWFASERSWKGWNNRYAWKTAGSVNKSTRGYPMLQIKVLGKLYIASRLVFLSMGRPLPAQVDHINGDSLYNRWSNLRASNNTENHKNQSMRRNNKSGVTGVSWDKRDEKWQAGVALGGKYHHLGRFNDLDNAAVAVGKFYAANGFSARHGQELSAYQEAK
jgi:hypothetical protein